MNTLVTLLLVACSVGLALCLIALHDAGKAADWMNDWNNKNKLIKCFGQEGILAHIKPHNQTVSLHFHHKGTTHTEHISWATAYSLYQEDPKGHGLRNKILKKFKKSLH